MPSADRTYVDIVHVEVVLLHEFVAEGGNHNQSQRGDGYDCMAVRFVNFGQDRETAENGEC